LAEPVKGESGVIVPPSDYFKQVREVCDQKGALLILDEIQSGLGRTGKMWASERWGVVPDIMTVSKGLGGGLPTGAAIATDDVASSLKGGEHTSTFAGNPLSCAAASATLDFITRNDPPRRRGKRERKLNRSLQRAILLKLKMKPILVRKTGTGDMSTFAHKKSAACVTYGPGLSRTSHTDGEMGQIKDYLGSIEVLKEAIRQLDALGTASGI
jgi:acetylornithine/succinyldiaminopimelate/putrescine aminotransferase